MASEQWILDHQSPDKRLKMEDSIVRGQAGSQCSLKFESPDKSLKREDSAKLRVKVEELIKQYFNQIYDKLINVFAKTEIDPEFVPPWSKLETDFRFKSKDTNAFVQDKGLASEDAEPLLKLVVIDIDYTSSSPELNARKRLEHSFNAVYGEEHPIPESIKLKGDEVPVQSSTSKKGPYPLEVNGDAAEDVPGESKKLSRPQLVVIEKGLLDGHGLRNGDNVVQFSKEVFLTRSSFLSLKQGSWVDSQVIDICCHTMAITESKRRNPISVYSGKPSGCNSSLQ